MRLYFHDILYDFSNSTANSTSAVVASPAALLRAANTTIFGTTVVFNDPMTEGTSALPPSLEETAVRAQGLYLYDGKAASTLNAWLAFSVVFNSTARRGTLTLNGRRPQHRDEGHLRGGRHRRLLHVPWRSPRSAPTPSRDSPTSGC
ncbi:hypothetical protein OsI_27027 [Oryza sativa Indica Group]|uniref:Dirigent protein n=1 Tax=Oryza sativa subsp. indica TaxID=39946 RepID=B8B523_ORYSI|nr:hypothetical protein OsI_27027 [Oryza sativa Indica Group]